MAFLAKGRSVNLRRLLAVDWEAIAGIIAAVAAIVMNSLSLVGQGVLISIAVFLIALLFIRDLRRDRTAEQVHTMVAEIHAGLESVRRDLHPSDVILVGPAQLQRASRHFAENAKGEMIWFHVCLTMFKPQSLFDSLLRPAIENRNVTSIQFILDEGQRLFWESEVLPKINACKGRDKVRVPRWTTIQESVSVIIADAGSRVGIEVLLSFWGEPFMARASDRSVPRYIFHVQPHSELATRLAELVRTYRFTT